MVRLFLFIMLCLFAAYLSVNAQQKAVKTYPYTSKEISEIDNNLKCIKMKCSNQESLLNQKSFVSYDEAMKMMKEMENLSNDISKEIKTISNKYERALNSDIREEETEQLYLQIEAINVDLDKLISGLKVWNPMIENRPLHPKSPEQLVKESDPCPLGSCDKTCDFTYKDCDDPYLPETSKESCEYENVRTAIKESECKQELAFCHASQIVKQVACRRAHAARNTTASVAIQ